MTSLGARQAADLVPVDSAILPNCSKWALGSANEMKIIFTPFKDPWADPGLLLTC